MKLNTDRVRRSEFLKNVFTLVSTTSIAQAVAILIYPILSRLYTPEDFGMFALYMSITAITAMVATGKYEQAIMIPRKDEDGITLSALAAFLAVGFCLLLLVFVIFFRHQAGIWLGNPGISKWLIFVPISTLLVAIFQISTFWSNREKKYKRMAGANLSQSVINSGVKIATAGSIASGGGLVAGAIAGQLMGAVWFVYGILRRETHIFRKVKTSHMRKLAGTYHFFPRYNMIHYVINNFSTNLPVFLLAPAFGSSVVGLYSLGFMMINRPANLLTSSFTQVFSQRIIQKFNLGEDISVDVKRMALRLFLIAAVPFLAAAFAGPMIFGFVFGSRWAEAGKFMQVLLPWLLIVFISAPLSFLPDLLRRQRKAMWLDILKFALRFAALGAGILKHNVYLALILFSAISCVITSYNLFWYISLSLRSDKKSVKMADTETILRNIRNEQDN